METRSILACAAACVLALAIARAADAEVVAWRATGIVTSLPGNPDLLPLPAIVGDAFALELSYDEAAVDEIPSLGDRGGYALHSLVITVAGQSLAYVSEGVGEGHVNIQAQTVNPNLWGASACLPACSNVTTYNQARLNLFFPPGTIASDALTPPPDPAGATVQFGIFSRTPADEAFLVASLIHVPAPGAEAPALAALATLGATARSAAARRRRDATR